MVKRGVSDGVSEKRWSTECIIITARIASPTSATTGSLLSDLHSFTMASQTAGLVQPGRLMLLVVAMMMMAEGAEGSCAAAGRCCEGKDNTCYGVVVYGDSTQLEHLLYGNVSKKSCYCDSSCVKLGDCCSDYRSHCPRTWAPFRCSLTLTQQTTFTFTLTHSQVLGCDSRRKKVTVRWYYMVSPLST